MTAQHRHLVAGRTRYYSPEVSSHVCYLSKLVDEGAFGACQHIGHLDLAVGSGSKVLAAAALESCSHHVEAHAACRLASEALRRHLLVSQVRRRYRHHFRCQQVRGRLDRPGRVL